MKQIRIILLLILTLAIALSSLTSCDVLAELGIEIPGLTPSETPDETPDEQPDDSDKVDPSTCGHYVTVTGQNKVAATCTTEGYTGDEVCYSCGTLVKAGTAIAKTEHTYVDGACSACGEEAPGVQIPDSWAQYETITIAEALALCEQFVSAPSTERYYIIATVKSVDNTSFGQLTIEDETGEIMVYGTNSADGSLKYDQMGGDLKPGDLVLLYGTLQNYKGNTKEVQNAWLIDSVAGIVVPPVATITPDTEITLEEAIANAALVSLSDRFYITATVKTVTKPEYGAMILVDEKGNELSVYGAYNADGTLGYAAMEAKPVRGDVVTVYANLKVFNGTPEIDSAWIVSFTHTEIDASAYTAMTVAEAREAAKDTYIKLQGVVAAITYANGYVPSGFYLVDGTNSIYVYDRDAAGQVSVGNTVTVVGVKDFWILETETNSASKFGYEGCIQLANAFVVENDNGNTSFDTSWITETTVKQIMDTPASENITTTIFKVTALIKKAPGSGFTNYYIDDIDGVTGSYVYTQCNGGDFSWLDQFDGKFCTVYLSAINAKSSTSGCVWRFFPIAVVDEGYTFDVSKAPEYAVTYHGLTQFLASYTGDPAIVLQTLVSSELLGFEGATLSYSSSNEDVVYFAVNENGELVFHGNNAGTATITVTSTHGGNTYSNTMEITIKENVEVEYITVADAIATPFDTDVVVKGIVGPSLVNRDGFYLFGEDGSMIAVIVASKDAFEGLAIGNEIVISGMRERFIKDDTYTTYGQDSIVNATIVANYYGNHEYSTEKFITDKTLADIAGLDATESHSTEVYVLTVTVKVVEAQFYSNIYLVDGETELLLYCSSASQYNWLKAYNGQEITVEVAPCNWNDKTSYRGCVLAVVLEDGSKIYNTLNFN